MTHARLIQDLKRPPGIPESECNGRLIYVARFMDTAQAVEGAIGRSVIGDLWRCGKCQATIVQREGETGSRLANTYFPSEFKDGRAIRATVV